jgi:acyl carrier protein
MHGDVAGVVKEFILANYLPDVTADQLGSEYDLLANGVIDSLGLLKLLDWLEERFQIPINHVEIAPDNFRSVSAICEFINQTTVSTK